ncbi:calcium-binding protein CBP-like [Impatiens glandulifera]|uniref:calcium-binding protein CBP-like n=1 Tax=Impatiens glandulifera TaxID=253017 RepID=UPI001FB0FE65|nr:calcium-binding protein CBP-like [Impatiens glandulifera]
MSGYPHNPQGYGYGQSPAQPYGAAAPYGQPPAQQPHGQQPYAPYGAAPQGATPYGAPSAPYGAPSEKPHKDKPQGQAYGAPPPGAAPGYPPSQNQGYGTAPTEKPQKDKPYGAGAGGGYGAPPPGATPSYPPQQPQGYGSPFASLVPSTFPPGTDPNIVACFQAADQDGSGLIDDKEMQRALSSYNQSFSLRTVHLLMYHFTNTNTRKIGPKEFTSLFYSLQNWRAIFERFDADRSGKIDSRELKDALLSLGFSVSPQVLDLLVSKFDKAGGSHKAIEYDNFIECCLTVKGLTEKFKEKDTAYSGSANFTYEAFMLTVLPFLIA